jgi:hypothetical protein
MAPEVACDIGSDGQFSAVTHPSGGCLLIQWMRNPLGACGRETSTQTPGV